MRYLIITLILAIFSNNAFPQDKTVSKNFDDVDRIDLNTGAGDAIVKKSSGNQVKVRMEYSYDEDNFEYVMEKRGTRLVLEEKFIGNTIRGRSTWTLEVPDNVEIDFNTGSGDFEIAGLESSIDGNVGSGDVKLEDINADAGINAGSGDLSFKNVNGDLRLNVGSGEIEIRDSDGIFDLNAGSGNVRLNNVTGGFSVNTGSGDNRSENIKIRKTSRFNSGSGDAEVMLSSPLENDISINSGSGDATLDFNGQPIEGHIVMEVIKGRGRIIAPFEFDKVEEIERGRETYIRKTVTIGNSDIKIQVKCGSGRAEIRK